MNAKPAIVALAICALALATPRATVAQSTPRGADTLTQQAVTDSQAVLRTLEDAIRANKTDALLRHRMGMIAWALSMRADAKPPLRGLNAITLRRMADTSLRIAVQLAPKNAEYQLSIGDFLRLAPDPTARFAAASFFDAALAIARAGGDPALRSRAAIGAGRVRWLRYESIANQVPDNNCPDIVQSIDAAAVTLGSPLTEVALKTLHNILQDCPQRVATTPAPGADLITAEALFREAHDAVPDDVRAFRQLMMLLAETSRWTEMASLARGRTARLPADVWAWLSLGVALQRSGRSDVAVGVFDTALTRLDVRERGRLFAFTRILSPPDSVAYAKADTSVRATRERSFWQLADPLWAREGNDPRTEFLARVAFAELRWTVEELNVRGADSDRGEMYIRYGPPNLIVALRGCHWSTPPCFEGGGGQSGNAFSPRGASATAPTMPQVSDIVTFWDYQTGLAVVFWGAPTYGTARYPNSDGRWIAGAVELRSASFDNAAKETVVDLPSRLARFRAPGDSVDLAIFAQAPLAAIRGPLGANSVNAPVRADLWMFPREYPTGYRDSSTFKAAGMERWTYRVPLAHYMYRIEATADGSMVAAKALGWLTVGADSTTGFTTRGLGVSDLLLATEVHSNNANPARWTEFSVTPLLGSIAKRTTLEIIWENYELGTRGGQAQYTISVTLQRVRSKSGRIAAAIVGMAASAVGVDQRSDRMTLKYDRATPSASTLVDHLSIALGDTPAGDYRLTLEILDKVSGRKVSSASQITIRE